MIYSRTARIEDYVTLQVDKNILRYAETKKNFTPESKPRYKFWDYSLAIELARMEKLKTVLDIGTGDDITYKVLANWHQIELLEVSQKEFKKLKIRDTKFQFITLFAQLEHVHNMEKFIIKATKHLNKDGFLLITTDDELINKYKVNVIGPEELIKISLMFEDRGFELYPYDVDYNDSSSLHSLLLKKVGIE